MLALTRDDVPCQVVMTVTMKIFVFWDAILRIFTNVFEEPAASILKVGTWKVEALGPFVMLVNIY